MIILGIDPGTCVTGYGLILASPERYKVLDFGCIRPPSKMLLSDRYLVIYECLEQLFVQHAVEAAVVETQFVQKNVQSAIKLGMARGVATVAAKKKGVPVFEYTPSQAKKAVVGNGKASKGQVQRGVQRLLDLPAPPHPEDAADALALALCHAHTLAYRSQTARQL